MPVSGGLLEWKPVLMWCKSLFARIVEVGWKQFQLMLYKITKSEE